MNGELDEGRRVQAREGCKRYRGNLREELRLGAEASLRGQTESLRLPLREFLCASKAGLLAAWPGRDRTRFAHRVPRYVES